MLYLKYIVLNTNQPPKQKVINPSHQKMCDNFTKISVHSSEEKYCICYYINYVLLLKKNQLLASEDGI